MDKKSSGGAFVPVAVSFAAGLVLSLACAFAFAGLVSAGFFPPDAAGIGGAAAAAIGAFVCASGCAGAFGKLAALAGIAAGLGFFLILLLLGSIVFARLRPETAVSAILPLCTFAGAAAGILRTLPGGRKRKRRS